LLCHAQELSQINFRFNQVENYQPPEKYWKFYPFLWVEESTNYFVIDALNENDLVLLPNKTLAKVKHASFDLPT